MKRVLALAGISLMMSAASAEAQGEVVPLEYFATYEAVANVALSPGWRTHCDAATDRS